MGSGEPTVNRALRRVALRSTVAALEDFRDALESGPWDLYERFARALMAETDALLHELMELEGVPPYPHPMGWWEEALTAVERADA